MKPIKIPVSAGCGNGDCPFFVSMESSCSSKDQCFHPAQKAGERLDLTNFVGVTPAECPAREHPLFELEVSDDAWSPDLSVKAD